MTENNRTHTNWTLNYELRSISPASINISEFVRFHFYWGHNWRSLGYYECTYDNSKSVTHIQTGYEMKTEHFVGHYKLGFKYVRLFVQADNVNGSVKLIPEDRGSQKINVGIDAPWSVCLGTLLHEAYESVLIELSTRYELQPSLSNESSDFMFFMTHNQLGEAHDRVAVFLEKALPDFSKAYKKFSTYKD
jgi:hypothetical protein